LDNSGTIDFEEFLAMVSQRVDYDEELRNAFYLFDKDGSGYISSSELKAAMNNFDENLTDEEIEEMIREADLDGDGEISFEGKILKFIHYIFFPLVI
jgi:calmodulin